MEAVGQISVSSLRDATHHGTLNVKKHTDQKNARTKKRLTDLINTLFKKEIQSVLLGIEGATQKGRLFYDHPILYNDFYKSLWSHVRIISGEPWTAGVYDLVQIKKSNLYTEKSVNMGIEKENFFRMTSSDEEWHISYFLARKIAKYFIDKNIPVFTLTTKITITKEFQDILRFKSNSHDMSFLRISWE